MENGGRDGRGRFSGQPGPGRPKGSRSKLSEAREKLEAAAEEIVDTLIEKAKAGDAVSLKLCLERILPVLKPTADTITLDGWEFANSPESRAKLVAEAVMTGKLSPEAGRDLVMALQGQLSITKAGEERDALNELLERNGLPRLDPKAPEEQAA